MTESTTATPIGRLARVRNTLAGIRFRIVTGYLLLMLVALAIAVLVTRQVQLARLDQEAAQEQAQEIEELRVLAQGVDPETGEPFGEDVRRLAEVFLTHSVPSDDEGFYVLVDGNPYLYSNGSPPLFDDAALTADWAATQRPTHTTRTTDLPGVGEVRSLSVPLLAGERIAGVFVVAVFPADDQREVAELVRVILISGLVVLLITGMIAWGVAGRILRPVRDLSAAARSINESDLSVRIPVEGHDELALLGGTFNDMVERLDSGFRQQRQFLDDVAHELRTPITIALGHLEVLGDDPAERAETVGIVTDELDRMSRYVSDLLTLAKAEQPNFLDERPVDVGELMEGLLPKATALGDRDWRLDEAPAPGRFAISADPQRLQQAMMNLAANAVQHTAAGDEIGLGAVARGGEVHLWVRDTGPGVEPEVVSTVFERATRGAASRVSRPDGMGIGLSIVAAIARAHGGRPTLQTGPDGATFGLLIPTIAEARPWPPPTPISFAPPSHAEEVT